MLGVQDLDIIIKHGITKTDINKFKEVGSELLCSPFALLQLPYCHVFF